MDAQYTYILDGEPMSSNEPYLTDVEILQREGLDTATHHLKEVVGNKVIDTPNHPDKIHVLSRRFISVYTGPTTNA